MKGRILMYGSIAGALAAILALVGMVANSPYRPATAGEIIVLAGEVKGNSASILLIQQNNNLAQIYDNLDRQEQVKRQGGDLTNLVRIERLLRETQERLTRELREVEGD